MTPQILLDALRKAFLNLKMVSLLILDECHRSTGNHPYKKIMKVDILFFATNFVVFFHLIFSIVTIPLLNVRVN
jgi:ERCC4-related helicase